MWKINQHLISRCFIINNPNKIRRFLLFCFTISWRSMEWNRPYLWKFTGKKNKTIGIIQIFYLKWLFTKAADTYNNSLFLYLVAQVLQRLSSNSTWSCIYVYKISQSTIASREYHNEQTIAYKQNTAGVRGLSTAPPESRSRQT